VIKASSPLAPKCTRGYTAAFNVVGKLYAGTYGTRVFWDWVYTEKSAHLYLCRLATTSKGKWHSCFFESCGAIRGGMSPLIHGFWTRRTVHLQASTALFSEIPLPTADEECWAPNSLVRFREEIYSMSGTEPWLLCRSDRCLVTALSKLPWLF